MDLVRTPQALEWDGTFPGHVWYVSYGSNMHLGRLACYLAGGTPPGSVRSYPGCRDPRAPARSVPVELVGCLYFATESVVWSGGRGFYDPRAAGRLRARAHLVTAQQFSDIAAQEMYREPGRDIDLAPVLRYGRTACGPGRYETLVCAGALEGVPLLTFTAPWSMDEVAWNSPSAPYLRMLAGGMVESGAWDAPSVADYLASRPGAAGRWLAREIMPLLAAG
ncbi:histone deacetylase [Streptomyces sp. NPDC006879]|uniref:histone deacetylase n=1 Tax=Streptomyces sp. NPDC006879 TaxID=3364767 RepID=UPI0036CA1A04